MEVYEIQKRYIENLAFLPVVGNDISKKHTRLHEDWVQLLTLIETSLSVIKKSLLNQRFKMHKVERCIKALKKLIQLSPRQIQQTEAKVSVIAREDLKVDLLVSYQVHDVSWQSTYDARLETGSRNVPSKLVIVRRASIIQSTGEVWRDIAIMFSTSRPSGRNSSPEFYPVTEGFLRRLKYT